MDTIKANIDAASGAGLTAFLLTSALILLAINYYTTYLSFYKQRGLKGPTPLPLVGNLTAAWTGERMKAEREWPEKYGKIYAIFHGLRPRIVICDPEVLQQICIRDFASMPNHDATRLLNIYQKNTILWKHDEEWKRFRSIQSPTFTSAKIRRMYKLLGSCVDDLVLNLSEELENQGPAKEGVNLLEAYSLYTMDSIATVAYTIKLGRKTKNNDCAQRESFVAAANKVFKLSLYRILISVTVPTSILELLGYETTPREYYYNIDRRLRPMLENRRKSGKKSDDYMQILLDARIDDQLELSELDDRENHHANLTQEDLRKQQALLVEDVQKSRLANGNSNGTGDLPSLAKGMTDDEIIASAVFLLVVGMDTTANLLTNCTYTLAFHQDIQEKLYQTVKSIADRNEETGGYSFDYEKLTSCEYLDAVVSETLRCVSVVNQIDRLVKEDYYIEKYDVQLKKGDRVMLGLYSVMNNPDYWTDPLKFDPERFVGDNKKKIVPGSYCPFGQGPRHCLGMRFSLTEAKLAVAKVIMKFRFEPMPGASFPPTFRTGFGINNIKDPRVKLTLR